MPKCPVIGCDRCRNNSVEFCTRHLRMLAEPTRRKLRRVRRSGRRHTDAYQRALAEATAYIESLPYQAREPVAAEISTRPQ